MKPVAVVALSALGCAPVQAQSAKQKIEPQESDGGAA